MARSVFGGNSSGVGGSSATPAIITTVTTGEAVQQGDIISLGADGLGYWAMDPAQIKNGAALRPLAAPVPVTGGLLGVTTVVNLIASQQISVPNDPQSVVLSNGNVLHAWGCATAPYNSVFMITDPSGAVVLPPTNGPANSSGGDVAVCALIGGGFVLATVSQAAGYNTYFTVYNNSGSVTLAATRFGSGAQVGTGSYSVLALLALSNGNFAMAADLASGGIQCPHLGVFTPAGAAVRAVAQVVAPGAAGGPASSTTNLIQLTGGGFGMACSVADGTNTTARFLTFNAAGVQQGVTVGGRTRVTGIGSLRAVALQNGNWMAAEISNSSWAPYVYVFNSAGVQQGATVTDFDAAPANSTALGNLIVLSSGNVLLTYVGGSGPHNINAFILSPASAKLVGSAGASVSLGVGASTIAPVVMSLTSDGWVMYSGTGAAAKYFKYSAGAISTLQADTTITAVANNNGTRLVPLNIAQMPPGAITFMVVGLQLTYISVEARFVSRQALTPIGVATASAANGSAVPVQITGNGTLRQGFSQPYALDANGSPTPGQRLYVVGNQIILSGLQPMGGRRQIN